MNVGLTASAYRLPRLIGIARAKRLLLTGLPIHAKNALNYGIITDIFEPDQLIPATIQLAKRIASKAPLAVQTAKRIASTSMDLPINEGLKNQQKALEILAHSEDYKAAVLAFSEKKKPLFKGK